MPMQANDTPAEAVDRKEGSWREQANVELEKIVALFSSTQLPDLCAKVLVNAPGKPSAKWSLGNQILMLLAGTTDARGYAQWQEVGRHVRKGAKALRILGPVFVKKQVGNAGVDRSAQNEGTVEVLVGFRTIPVFRCEDTEGAELPVYSPRDPPPLLAVAAKFGMQVTYQKLAPGVLGVTDHNSKTITLATESWEVFFHELAHSVHRTFDPKTGHGQEPEAETIAQLVAATLARLYERPADAFSWSYIAQQAASDSPQKVGRLCMRVLDKTRKVLELIFLADATEPAHTRKDAEE